MIESSLRASSLSPKINGICRLTLKRITGNIKYMIIDESEYTKDPAKKYHLGKNPKIQHFFFENFGDHPGRYRGPPGAPNPRWNGVLLAPY